MQQTIPPNFVTTTQEDLERLAEHIKDIDPLAATRLTMLSEALVNQPASGNSTGPSTISWASRNVHEIIDIDTITELARGQESHRHIRSWLEWLRNGLIILPLTLTWLGISGAVNAYHSLLGSDPDQAKQPFIFLWEQGFGGKLPWWSLTLSGLAFIDFLLLTSIFALTLFVSWQQDVKGSKQEKEREQDTANLRSELADALGRAALCLGERQLGQPVDFMSVVMRLDDVTQKTATQLKDVTVQVDTVVKQFLIELQEERQQRGSLNDFLHGLETITNKIFASATAIQGATDTLTTSLDALAKPVQEISTLQEGLLQKAQGIFTQLEPVAKDLHQLATEQQDFYQDLDETLTKLVEQQNDLNKELRETIVALDRSQVEIVQMIQGVETTTEMQKEVIQIFKDEHHWQEEVMTVTYQAADEMKKALRDVQETATDMQTLAKSMSNVASFLHTLPDELRVELLDPLKHYSQGAAHMVSAAHTIEEAGKEILKTARLQGLPNGQWP